MIIGQQAGQRLITEDEACVALLWGTSSPAVRARVRYEERWGLDAYAGEPPTWRERQHDPRSELRVCGASDCYEAFWTSSTAGGGNKRYCSERCRIRAAYRRGYRRPVVVPAVPPARVEVVRAEPVRQDRHRTSCRCAWCVREKVA